jgi:serine/threonine-protein kinase
VQTASGGIYLFSTGNDYAAASASAAAWSTGTLPAAPSSPFAPAAYPDGAGITLFRVTPSGGLQFTHGH